MDALDQWIARRTDRGLLYIVLGIIALFILGGVGYELLESMRA